MASELEALGNVHYGNVYEDSTLEGMAERVLATSRHEAAYELKRGLWMIGTSFLGFLGVFDLGLSTAVAKYIAEYHEEGDISRLSATSTSGIQTPTVSNCFSSTNVGSW